MELGSGEACLVVRTKPLRERWAAENVARQGYKYYLPFVAAEATAKTKKLGQKLQCMFPSYLFVYTNGPWRFLESTFGVVSVVKFGQNPAILRPHEIEELRARENSSGFIELPEKDKFKFHSGDRVRITTGLFSNYSGVYDRDPENRVRVFLNMLGRYTAIPVSEEALEAAS